jgi:glycolate oxidase subunit GlcD
MLGPAMSFLSELRAAFPRERVLTEPAQLLVYECDGYTLHKERPLAVVLAESTADVVRTVELCNRHGVPFVPRGAGTCLSGGPTPSPGAILIELARMNRILEVDPENGFAVVEPGVINLDLTRAVARHGLHYAPDPSSQAACTIGGNVAENSGGPHCFKYGMTTNHILGVEVVLPDGQVAQLGGPCGSDGYDLRGVFIGSEGTFGIATRIWVRLMPDPQEVRTFLAAFRSMEAACRSVSRIVASGLLPAALEILDDLTIKAVEASIYAAGYPQDAAAVLLVELDGLSAGMDDARDRILAICGEEGAISLEEARDPAARLRLWKGRKGAFGAMGRLNPDLYVLDGVVPRGELPATLAKVKEIARRYELTLSNVFHAGDGNLHPNISYDGRDPIVRARVLAAGSEILAHCVAVGGSITGEHGIGVEKLDHVTFMFTRDDLEVMERVRRVWNPRGLCNPGKVLPERSACREVAATPAGTFKALSGGLGL